jgi:hypothetical protein
LWERHLREARERAFAGRQEEMRLFRSAIDGGRCSPTVLFVHGPGGIGKSILLRRFATEAERAGRVVVDVDGRTIEPTPGAFEAAACEALIGPRVLLVDAFERCQGLEGWLRDRFLPRLMAGTVVVIAGRNAPGSRWTSDPGWIEMLRVLTLRNLAPADAIALLDARGVRPESHDALLAFTGGHPLALTLAAAAAVQDEGAAATWTPTHDLVETLMPQLVGDVPSPAHRRALEVCAHAYVTTEALLRATLGDDAGPLFAWLRRQPFVESTRRGVFPHDVVREVLEHDLRWRDPDGYEAMRHRIHGYLFERVRAAPESRMPAEVGAFLYPYRRGCLTSELHGRPGAGEVRQEALSAQDAEAMLRLAAEAEGEQSAAIARFWWQRRPEAFRVYRSAETGETVAFAAWLRLFEPEGEDVDPVVAAAWSHARAAGPLRAGEYLGIARFSVYPAVRQGTSPGRDLMVWRAIGEVIRDSRVAWSYLVEREGELRSPEAAHFEMNPIAARPPIGDWTYTLFAHDWRVHPVKPWLERKARGTHSDSPSGQRELVVLSRPEFDAAVRRALRSLRQPAALAANPLTRSRVVAEHTSDLADLLNQAVTALREEKGGEKYYRAVTATFLSGAPTQEAASERLGLPFSTYRRHLTVGIERICDEIWKRELQGHGLN